MLPVVAMCGQRCGFDMTATTAIPDAVLTGLARSLHVHERMDTCRTVMHMPAHKRDWDVRGIRDRLLGFQPQAKVAAWLQMT